MKVEVTTKYRNKQLLDCIRATGCKNVAQFCQRYDFAPTIIVQYLNFKSYPRRPTLIKRLEKALRAPFDYMFPEEYRRAVDLELGRTVTKEMDVELTSLEFMDERKLISYDPNDHELIESLYDTLDDRLTDREKQIIQLRFGLEGEKEHTYQAVADRFKLTKERIRQIESVAMNKLKSHNTKLYKQKKGML
jgi:RNA polymerase sigma factor (sigma-70 family)